MCGIVATLLGSSNTNCAEKLSLSRLKNLEYRGYDSFGYFGDSSKEPIKKIGAVSEFYIDDFNSSSRVAIAHTRWATHGVVNVTNAHPHESMHYNYTLVHNGVISNYENLKDMLSDKGFKFRSDTDSEVIANLLEWIDLEYGCSSVINTLEHAKAYLRGEYAVCLLRKRGSDNRLYALCQDSSLVFGFSDNLDHVVVASDPNALGSDISKYYVLENGEIVSFFNSESKLNYVSNIYNSDLNRKSYHIESHEDGTHFPFPDYMTKEMSEIPNSIRSVIENPNLDYIHKELINSDIIMVGCGSAYYASQIGSHFREKQKLTLTFPADEIENLYSLRNEDTLICVSQSGETYDTLAPAKFAVSQGIKVLSITNSKNSTLGNISDTHIYQNIGQEKCVLSTKSIVNQCTIFAKIFNNLSNAEIESFADCWDQAFNPESDIIYYLKSLASEYKSKDHFFHIGRGIYSPIAYENALKLKEVTYVHAEAMGAGFFKHGTLSLIDDRFITFAHLPSVLDDEALYHLTESNIKEIESRNGVVFRVGFDEKSDIILPHLGTKLQSLLHLGVGQYFAYFLAKELSRNVDRPRSLAKSVTVR